MFLMFRVNGTTMMNQDKIKELKHLFNALNNPARIKIVLLCSEEELSITEISKRIKLGYTTTSEYVSMLERVGLVRKMKRDKETLVKSLVEITEEGEIRAATI
jgi:DNA-binding transcriptional ArsR family regulator